MTAATGNAINIPKSQPIEPLLKQQIQLQQVKDQFYHRVGMAAEYSPLLPAQS